MFPPTYLTTLLATATLTLARTPPGFAPAATTDLIVEFSGIIPLNGVEVPRNSTEPHHPLNPHRSAPLNTQTNSRLQQPPPSPASAPSLPSPVAPTPSS